MQVVARIIIILLIVFLVWLLRRWIKRLVFIFILLALAFLIYGIFNPSGAAKLWYNVRTFPKRVASWMGSSEQFLNYDSYKLGISSIDDEVGDEIDLGDNENDDNLELDDIELNEDKEDVELGNGAVNDDEKIVEDVSQDVDKRAIKAFQRSIKFVDFSQLVEKNDSKVEGNLAGYSKSDLLLVISKYIEENLDDDTDILVTVEYEDDGDKPQRVILETRPRTSGKRQSIYFSSRLLGENSTESKGKNDEIGNTSAGSSVEKTNEKKTTKSIQRSSSNKLSQKEQQEAEEIFSILF